MPTKILLAAPDGDRPNELSRRQAADMLQMTPRGVDKLLASGYLPDLAIPRVLGLSRRPTLLADGADQPILRQGPVQPAPEGEGRDYIGEGTALTDDQQVEADRKWWRCDHEAVLAAGLLPVTVAGFPVSVLRIAGEPTQVRTILPNAIVEVRWEFQATLAGRVRALGEPNRDYIAPGLTDEERRTVTTILAGRSTARSGGPIAYLPRADQ